eukprot:3953921-Prymnesium_polylepis.1
MTCTGAVGAAATMGAATAAGAEGVEGSLDGAACESGGSPRVSVRSSVSALLIERGREEDGRVGKPHSRLSMSESGLLWIPDDRMMAQGSEP